jgi:diaminopimelate epimerase
MNFKFTKMQGAGNDFLLMDYMHHDPPQFYPKEIQYLCDRHFGIGADGVVLLQQGDDQAHAKWKFYNSDGSEAEMCGNAARCAIRFLSEKYFREESLISIQTKAGVIKGKKLENNNWVEVALLQVNEEESTFKQMMVKTEAHTYDVRFLNTGVPHAVIEVKDIFSYPINQVGRELLKHPAFGPAGTNVTFFQKLIGSRIRATTFERGVEAETMACGTGVVAAALVFMQEYMEALPVEVVVPGGEMRVDMSPVSRWVLLQGPAEYVFEVELEGSLHQFEPSFPFSQSRRER